MRTALSPSTYLWVNAYKRVAGYYTPAEVDRIVAIDPLFELKLNVYASRGRACKAGEETITRRWRRQRAPPLGAKTGTSR